MADLLVKKDDSTYQNMTKVELVEIIKTLFKERDLALDQLNVRNTMLADTGEAGTLVSTPNPAFTGKAYGTNFVGGRAFIPDGGDEKWTRRTLQDMQNAGYRLERMTAKEFKALKPNPAPVREKSGMEEMIQPARIGG